MKNKFVFIILIFAGTISSYASNITVCNTCKIKSIQKAIEIAPIHSVIVIKSGTYFEHNIKIDKPLTLKGENNPVIDGEHKGYVLDVAADSISIIGLTIRNVGQSYTKDYAAIRLYKSHNFTLTGNRLENVFFGFLIEKSNGGLINNNIVSSKAIEEYNSGNGIHLWHCNSVKVHDNEAFGLRDGIYFEFVKNSLIYNNHSHDNLRYGLHFMFSNKNEYYHNVFETNGAGVAVMFSKYIKMHHNIFTKNWGGASYGLLLKEIYDAEIHDNEFSENTIAINAEGCTRINYISNEFRNNGWAIKIVGACYLNIFTKNNFLYNSFDLSYNSKLNDNSFNGNYWSANTTYDLDKNGIGDVPFRPVKLFNYVVNKTPESIVLLRSLFIDILDFSEKVSPVFTPDEIKDNSPLMNKLPFELKFNKKTK